MDWVDKYYQAPARNWWSGRVDSEERYTAFRWHQKIHPVDLREKKEVLAVGQTGFAFLGFCCDEGIRRNRGRVGAAKGPWAIRREASNLPCRFLPEVVLVDAGNVVCENGNLEEAQAALAEAVKCLRERGLFPLVLGGGHEVALGHFRGQRDFLLRSDSDACIGIINFDAHFDLRPLPLEGSSGTMFRQIAEDCRRLGQEFRYFCLGIQEYSNTADLFRTARELGVCHVKARELQFRSGWITLDVLDRFIRSVDYLYVTICTDVFSAAFAPGVSAIQPLGLDPETVLHFLKHILLTDKVVGLDIAEVSPRFDHDNTTASLAKVLLFASVNTLCMNKGLEMSLLE